MGAFGKGDPVVHPRHGAAVVEDVVELETSGERQAYLKLCLPHGLTLMVPVDNTSEVGLRRVVSRKDVEKIFDLLGQDEGRVSEIWSQRYKVNLAKLTSGDLYQVSEVIRHLTHREKEKSLSVADMRMLAKAREMLISELIFVMDSTPEGAEQLLDDALGATR